MAAARRPDLLLFNLATDEEDPVLGFTTQWINALARHCSSVDVVTMTAGRVNVGHNVQVFSVGKEKGYTEPRRAVEFYRILSRRLRAKHFDAALCHMIPLFGLMAAPLLKPRGVKLVLWYAHKAAPLTLRAAERIADRVLTPTRESFPLPSHKLMVVGHGIDTSLFTPVWAQGPARPKPFTILSVGRVAPIKGLEVLIEAVQILAKSHPPGDFRVRIVGPVAPKDAAYAEELARAVASSGLQDRIAFVGPRPSRRMPAEYRSGDLLVNVSRTGSADKVVLESMACEVPAITTNPAFVEMLSPWAEVLLSPPEDPEALALRIRRMMDSPPSERKELGRALREVVERDHSLDRLVRRLVLEVF